MHATPSEYSMPRIPQLHAAVRPELEKYTAQGVIASCRSPYQIVQILTNNMSESTTTIATSHEKTNEKGVGPYVSELNRNDVLMGRGANIDRFIGNVRFRQLIQQRKVEYSSTTTSPEEKNRIAQEVIDTVHRINGRFLRKVVNSVTSSDIGVAASSVWTHVRPKVMMDKVKQAFRDCSGIVDDSNHTTMADHPLYYSVDPLGTTDRTLLSLQLPNSNSSVQDTRFAFHEPKHPAAAQWLPSQTSHNVPQKTSPIDRFLLSLIANTAQVHRVGQDCGIRREHFSISDQVSASRDLHLRSSRQELNLADIAERLTGHLKVQDTTRGVSYSWMDSNIVGGTGMTQQQLQHPRDGSSPSFGQYEEVPLLPASPLGNGTSESLIHRRLNDLKSTLPPAHQPHQQKVSLPSTLPDRDPVALTYMWREIPDAYHRLWIPQMRSPSCDLAFTGADLRVLLETKILAEVAGDKRCGMQIRLVFSTVVLSPDIRRELCPTEMQILYTVLQGMILNPPR